MTSSTSDAEQLGEIEEIEVRNGKSLFRPKVPALIVSKSETKGPNALTAMWWTAAGYRPYKMVVAIAHSTYTYEIMEENREFVMAAPTRDMMDAVVLCGRKSGRDVDKLSELSYTLLPSQEIDVPLIADAAGNLECVVDDWFEYEGHTYYFAKVKRAYVKTGWWAPNGNYSANGDPLAYLGVFNDDERGAVRQYSHLPSDRYELAEREILGDD